MKTLKIHFLSDWHIGEGTGQPGHIDKLIRRHPQDGLPYLPAKTIAGIWRDACEQIAIGLDNGKTGPWQKWVTTLFGIKPKIKVKEHHDIAPKTACLVVRAARFPQSLRQKLADYPSLKEALTFVKPTVRIERQTGHAIDDELFFNEMVRAGAVLETPISIEGASFTFTKAQEKAAYALLWAGAKAVERLGGQRRRGTGRCEFQMSAITQKEALKILSLSLKKVPACPEPLSEERQFISGASGKASQTDTWVQVPLHLTLKTPVLVPNGEMGNVIYSLDFIPGTLLLGVVTQLLRRATHMNFFPYIINGDIQVNHAYQEVLDTRGQPIPMALAENQGGQVWNCLIENPENPEKTIALKQHRQGYISHFDEQTQTLPGFLTTPLQLTTHGSQENCSLFSFHAIKAGTSLQSVLKLRQSVADKFKDVNWWKILNTDIRVGKSKKDDYGWVQLQADTCEPIPALPMQHDNKKLVVWLCSDLLLRDARLRPSTDVSDLQKELEKQLNVTLSHAQSDSLFARTSRKDGWHQKWGQPRPSYIGLAAGSCIVFMCESGTLDQDKLQGLMYRGLGERRAEGFGELRFNPPLLMRALSTLPSLDAKNFSSFSSLKQGGNSNSSIPKEAEEFVKILETAVWRVDMQRIALTLSTNTRTRRAAFGWHSNKPPNSQLGALRAVISRMASPTDKQHVLSWLNHLSKTSNRRDKWSVHALKTIKSLVESPQFVWDMLHKAGEQSGLKNLFPTIRANAKASLENELWAQAVRTLFLIAMHHERKEREHSTR